MNARRVMANITSSWVRVVVMIGLAFLVTPIIRAKLGDELYGIWTVVTQLTGMFTILDLGINTAIIRYISRHEARDETDAARRVFSTSLALFFGLSLVVVVASAVLSPVVANSLQLNETSRRLVAVVFMIVGGEVAIGLLLSVYQATFRAQQRFVYPNAVQLLIRVLKNAAIVALLFSGASILSMAIAQIVLTALRGLLLYWPARKRYRFRRADVTRDVTRQLLGYSFFSFLISIVIQIFFSSYSLIIGTLIHADQVLFFDFPMRVLIYAERLVDAAMAALTPLISANEAVDATEANRQIFIYGTRYALLVIVPMMLAIGARGDAFLGLWVGEDVGERGAELLPILCLGMGAYLAQRICNSVLKGVSRHRVYAFILAGAAAVVLIGGIATARPFGLVGIAWSLAGPLAAMGLVAVPVYTCHVLGLSYFDYLRRAWLAPLLISIPVVAVVLTVAPKTPSYLSFLLFCGLLQAYFVLAGVAVVMEPGHRAKLLARFRRATS